jgi:hypothetical protein
MSGKDIVKKMSEIPFPRIRSKWKVTFSGEGRGEDVIVEYIEGNKFMGEKTLGQFIDEFEYHKYFDCLFSVSAEYEGTVKENA